MWSNKKRKDEPSSKRLQSSKKKKSRGLFQRRKNNQPCKTPDGLGQITTPNVHDMEPNNQNNKPEQKDEYEQNDALMKVNGKQRKLTKKEQMEQEFGVKYNYICDIGAGAFGKVVKVTKKKSASNGHSNGHGHTHSKSNGKKPSDADKVYAIKIVDNIFTSLAKAKRFLREIRILRILSQHESIVELIDLVPPPNPLKFNKLSIVFEFMPTDLKKIFRSKQYFSNLHIEYILYQILLGLKFCHTAGIYMHFHRIFRYILPRSHL